MKLAGLICLLASLVATNAAHAADPFYVGGWKLTSAVTAPWADPQRTSDDAERTRLLGKTVVFKVREIAGPRPFACAQPHYRMTAYGADMIFQGAFDEMRSNNKKAEPKTLAASVGLTGDKIKTLETGCEIDFHFVDDTTAEVALNNIVYTLKKQ